MSCRREDERVRVDVERDDDRSHRAWVDGLVGDEPVRFLLDTGARRCRVPHIAATSELVATGTDTGVGAAGVTLGEDEVVVPAMGFDGIVVRDVDATRSAPGATTMPLLGMSALGRFVCDFRLADGVVDMLASAPERDWRPMSDRSIDQPLIDVEIDGVGVVACWDTGAGFSAFDMAFAREHPELFERHGGASGFDSSDVALDVELATVGPVRAAGLTFEPSTCVLLDFAPMNEHAPSPIVAVIGLPLILRADWCFDFHHRRWACAL